ncbi:MAG TPA: hypothetical protein DCR24_10100 [Bacillus bacterium]|nr:hypothetical protein [Bacillus sp. (in: firmicutes)]
MNAALGIATIFLVSTVIIFLILRGNIHKKQYNSRIMELFPPPADKVDPLEQEKVKKQPLMNRIVTSLAKIFKNVQFNESTQKLLLEAGSKLSPAEFFSLKLFSAVSISILCLLLGLPVYLLAAVLLAGYNLPGLYFKKKRKKRIDSLSYQLIEVLGMMANSMRAGFSFMQAIQLVGKEFPDPLGPEFTRVIRQAGLGIPLDEVFEELVDRLPNKELEVVIRGILAQRKSGGNLAELLETMEETIRGRVRILEELNTLTAQGRMSSWIITLLPVGLGLYLATANGAYFRPMLEHPLGLLMISAGVASNIIGWVFIQKIIRIEV